ncbi:MAG: hypothetical protein KA713_01180 [Chryseotalea sp. WA131a]|jgi:hypothetical protein|nr:MAG: hypothetical protein KA713_01180 [Chryseotalea sp. WA131a]
MTFEYSDAWLLEAIKFSEKGDKGSTLTDIIQAADYINHSIMTNSEFVTGTTKLKRIGLIIEEDKRLRTTEKFNEWWTEKYGQKSKISVLKAMEEIEKYLNKNFGNVDESTTEIKTEITDADLDKSTKDYLAMADEIITKLTTKKKKR